MTAPLAAPDLDAVDALLERGRQLFESERLEGSLAAFESAHERASAAGDRIRTDRAFVNVSAVLVSMRRGDGLPAEHLQRLREILMAGEDDTNCRLAAYNIARAAEFTKDFRKGQFYARIALDRSRVLANDDWLASSHNQLGNLLIAESRFEDASAEYERALALLSTAPSVRRALILTNLGYAQVVLGRPRRGVARCYESLRTLRRLGSRREQITPLLDLCFGLLELGKLERAVRHGLRALAFAEEAGERDSVRHALFLLGEAAQQAGDTETARARFASLQRSFFPEAPHLTDVLLTVDVRKLINLKA